MEQAGFWSRVGQWFKTSRRGDAPDVSLTRLPRGGLLGQEGPNPPADGLRTGLTFSRRRQREQAIEQLQEAYQQVAGLIESIVNHLQTQQERSGQVATALTRLAHTTTQVCEAAVAQSEQLGAIAAQLEAGNDRARRWEQTLFNLPKLAEGQREALTALRQELQAGQEADRRMIDTMEGLHGDVEGVKGGGVSA